MIFADSNVIAEPRVLIAASGTATDGTLSSIVSRTAAVEASRAGLIAVPWERANGSIPAGDAVASIARTSDADFILRVRYQDNNGTLTVDMQLLTADGKGKIADAHQTFPISLVLDSQLANAFRGFLSAAAPKMTNAVTVHPSGTQKEKGSATPAIPERTHGVPAETAGVRPGVSLSLGTAPFLLVGTASDSFRYGVRVAASGGYRFELFHAAATAGLEISAVRIFPIPNLPQGTVYVVSASPVFRIGTSLSAPASIAFKVEAGPAVLTAQLPGGSLLAKTVLTAEAGFSGRLRIGRTFLFGVEIGYLAVFESANPVMGVVPGISLTYEP